MYIRFDVVVGQDGTNLSYFIADYKAGLPTWQSAKRPKIHCRQLVAYNSMNSTFDQEFAPLKKNVKWDRSCIITLTSGPSAKHGHSVQM